MRKKMYDVTVYSNVMYWVICRVDRTIFCGHCLFTLF